VYGLAGQTPGSRGQSQQRSAPRPAAAALAPAGQPPLRQPTASTGSGPSSVAGGSAANLLLAARARLQPQRLPQQPPQLQSQEPPQAQRAPQPPVDPQHSRQPLLASDGQPPALAVQLQPPAGLATLLTQPEAQLPLPAWLAPPLSQPEELPPPHA